MPYKGLKTSFDFRCHQLGAGQADVTAEELSSCFYLCMVTGNGFRSPGNGCAALKGGAAAYRAPRASVLGHGIEAEHLSVSRMLSSEMIARTYRYLRMVCMTTWTWTLLNGTEFSRWVPIGFQQACRPCSQHRSVPSPVDHGEIPHGRVRPSA
jgi:hypothetical protein